MQNCDIFTTPGLILLYVMMNPGCTAGVISRALHLSLRTCRGALAQLREAGLVRTERSGRYLLYRIKNDGSLATPFSRDITVKDVFSINTVRSIATTTNS